MNEETCNELDLLAHGKIQDGGEYLHNLFSFKSFYYNFVEMCIFFFCCFTLWKIFHINYFVIENFEKTQQIFDCDHKPARLIEKLMNID